MSKAELLLSLKLNMLTANGELIPLVSKQSISIPSDKLTSEGVRMGVHNQVNEFLDSAANKACILPDNIVDCKSLVVAELRTLANLIESGERVCTTAVHHSVENDLIVVSVPKPKEGV